jgi:phage shock protein E
MGIFGNLFAAMSTGSAKELPSNAVLIDVRSSAEFASGHIEHAISLPLSGIGDAIRSAVPDPESPIIVYCRSGARSASAARQLTSLGYRLVVNGGGLDALSARMGRNICK